MVQWITLKVSRVVAGDVFKMNWNVVEFIEKKVMSFIVSIFSYYGILKRWPVRFEVQMASRKRSEVRVRRK